MPESHQRTATRSGRLFGFTWAAELIQRRPEIAWFVLATAAFLVATLTFWISDALILDDYVACAKTEELGILGMAKWYFFEFVGLYRPLTVPMLMGTGALCEVPAVARAFGLVLHLTGAGLAFHLARTGLRWHRVPSAFASLAILFSPVAMAGAGWIAAGRAYPFALVLVLWMTLRLVTGKWGWSTALLGAFAVVVQEQTLFVVLFLMFVLTPGSFWRRTRATAMAAGPIVAYFLVLIASSRFLADAARFGSDDGASVRNLVENFGASIGMLHPYIPFGSIWRSFAHGPFTASVWVAIILIGIGVAITAWQDHYGPKARESEGGRNTPRALRAGIAAFVSLVLAVLLVLPLMLAAGPWVSPRVTYLPLAALAFFFAAMVEILVLVSGRASVILGTTAVVMWAFVVIPGVARDAAAMTESSRQEQSIAEEIAVAAIERSATVVILPNPPWSIAPNGRSLADHLAQAFAVPWAAKPALVVLTDLEPEIVVVDRDLSVCSLPGTVLNANTGEAWPVSWVLVYDFANRRVVPEEETASSLPECETP